MRCSRSGSAGAKSTNALFFFYSSLSLTIKSFLALLKISTPFFPSKTGPDRLLYLPGGLLDRSEIPSYLNGTLAGE